jgi:Flp pilus assembly protein TadB
MAPVLRNPWAQLVVVFLLVWEAIGILVTKKIVTVDI